MPGTARRSAARTAQQGPAASAREHSELGLSVARNERGLRHFVLDVASDRRGELAHDTKQLPRYSGFQRGQQCLEKLRPRVRMTDLRAHTGNTSAFLGSNIGMIRHVAAHEAPRSMMQTATLTSHAQRKGCRAAVREGRPHNKTRGNLPNYGQFSLYVDESIRKHVNLSNTGHG